MPWLFNNPAHIDYNDIDEPIRDLVQLINRSEWLKTEESCVGHPNFCRSCGTGWGDMSDLYLRLVVTNKIVAYKLLTILDAIRNGIRGNPGWTSLLEYERTDELGSHWMLKVGYGHTIDNRDRAVAFITQVFKDSGFP